MFGDAYQPALIYYTRRRIHALLTGRDTSELPKRSIVRVARQLGMIETATYAAKKE